MDADASVVSRLAAGDMDAASELYDRHAGQVLALARRICVTTETRKTWSRTCSPRRGERQRGSSRPGGLSAAGCS